MKELEQLSNVDLIHRYGEAVAAATKDEEAEEVTPLISEMLRRMGGVHSD